MTERQLPGDEVEGHRRDRVLRQLADAVEDGVTLSGALRTLDVLTEMDVDPSHVLRSLVVAGLLDVVVVRKHPEDDTKD